MRDSAIRADFLIAKLAKWGFGFGITHPSYFKAAAFVRLLNDVISCKVSPQDAFTKLKSL